MGTPLDTQVQAAEQEWLEGWKRGPVRTRWKEVPLQVGDSAPDLELQDASGASVHLRDFWRDRPALLLFWRHYGCGCGIDRARKLQQEYADYVAAGANVAVIGQGEPERAAAYAAKYALLCPILCDPSYRTYEAYGLLEGKPSQIFFDASKELLQCDFDAGLRLAQARREADRPLVDSPWQLPGEFVVDHGGIISLAYRYQYCEDFPNPLVLVAAIKEAVTQDGRR